ncbi:uncharacterized protein LOC131852601 isoform X2 [Achroia grisella]|nr:uncharacterized protein LOC131852601 isoform X2 [Achroia grisella]XP_059059271.1 uncharacterized protein LOC131852601 isoform X2 [Achroia grisella]
MWKNRWVRGIISLELHFLIWLIDYGIYLRPDDKTVYINLPTEYKKLPTKLFEASIHGVVPVDKALNEDCQIVNTATSSWNAGAVKKAQSLIENAENIYFVPIALLSTQHNEIVLGDLYIETKNKQLFNIIDELEVWPVFLDKNKEVYFENISKYYIRRRQHRACLLKPDIPDLPTITSTSTFLEYNAICANAEPFEISIECDSPEEDGSTIVEYDKHEREKYNLTPAEIEKYSNMYITLCGREYNVLNILSNKIKDLIMCERYKDHDRMSVGRGVGRRRSSF